mgnify:CR=1 FL=1
MSTSLNKDLHSVYIDGEMPETFISQYETLVSSSEQEKAELSKMQNLHSILQEDSSQKTISPQFAEESFERLQTKMRYSKNVSFALEQKSFVTPFAKYAASFAAAAAVFAVVFIPLHYNSLNSAKETAVAAISIIKEKNIEPIAKKEVVIDGTINPNGLALGSAKNTESETLLSNTESSPALPAAEQKTISATNLASNYGSRRAFTSNSRIEQRFREKLTAIDPFIPDFSSSSITIPIPNFQEIDNNLEIMKNQQE